jgi:hypothetical protein
MFQLGNNQRNRQVSRFINGYLLDAAAEKEQEINAD